MLARIAELADMLADGQPHQERSHLLRRLVSSVQLSETSLAAEVALDHLDADAGLDATSRSAIALLRSGSRRRSGWSSAAPDFGSCFRARQRSRLHPTPSSSPPSSPPVDCLQTTPVPPRPRGVTEIAVRAGNEHRRCFPPAPARILRDPTLPNESWKEPTQHL